MLLDYPPNYITRIIRIFFRVLVVGVLVVVEVVVIEVVILTL